MPPPIESLPYGGYSLPYGGYSLPYGGYGNRTLFLCNSRQCVGHYSTTPIILRTTQNEQHTLTFNPQLEKK